MIRKVAILLATVLVLIISTIGCGDSDQEIQTTITPTQGLNGTPTTQPITLKLVTSPLANSPDGQTYYHFAELMEKYTDGQVLVDIYPGSQLFPATEQWEAVVSGAVDIFADSTYYVYNYVPDVMVFYIDGLWESYEQAYAALEDSELPQILATKIDQTGPVKTLCILPGVTTACIVNSVRETQQLMDLEGFRTQSAPGAPPPALYDYTGMAAIPLSYEETSTAFIQGVLDAIHRPPHVITAFKTHETAKHALCRTSWFTSYALIINRDSWEALSSNIQDIILNKVVPETYEFAKMTFREAEAEALELIQQNVDTLHWVTQEDMDAYLEYAKTHPIIRTQMLMVDPEIIDIIDELRPSNEHD
ncbi:MAG: TRAP transporter substrate-binding protein DctP [Dehalococcoidia bacterium]|nr:MAG: TRAP transporter substrate-binding protein DctP [Dehalococcoidia bacterium]UCG84318.1 MAG: TRAP transporter substrate-binding protein DctP [Dehalococcoidia bacterium]